MLLPSAPGKGPDVLTRMASNMWQQGKSDIKGRLESGRETIAELKFPKEVEGERSVDPADTSEPSFFSLQVASFRDKKEAHRAVLGWQARGQDAFVLPPEAGSDAFRVFVGRLDKLADANALAAILENDENVRAYITLLPVDKKKIK